MTSSSDFNDIPLSNVNNEFSKTFEIRGKFTLNWAELFDYKSEFRNETV